MRVCVCVVERFLWGYIYIYIYCVCVCFERVFWV